MQQSEVMIHGVNKQIQIKIIDKTKRAFDTSVESTRALEIALSKDNR